VDPATATVELDVLCTVLAMDEELAIGLDESMGAVVAIGLGEV